MASVGRLEWPDYVVLAVFLVISVGIGFYHSLTGGRQRTTEEFIMANRRLDILPTTLSLFVSFQSAVTMLGLTAEMYMYGVQVLVWMWVGFTVALLFTERFIVPWLYPLRLVSINAVGLKPRTHDKQNLMLANILNTRRTLVGQHCWTTQVMLANIVCRVSAVLYFQFLITLTMSCYFNCVVILRFGNV